MLEQVILVDNNDKIIGVEEKITAHKLGLLHRAFSIFVLCNNPDLELLMQKRSLAKYHSSGLWSNSCCGHPRPSESVMEAAKRRLNEEIGLNIPLKEIGVFTYKADVGTSLIEHEIDHVFIGYWRGESIRVNPREVSTVKWSKIDEIFSEINNTPSLFTAWFKETLAMVDKFTKD